ncbi:hypothetical protein SRHO_G00031910 [Serrasalmus rhombeus]
MSRQQRERIHFKGAFIAFSLQVEADDVLTKEEQIYLLFNAKRKCERAIKSRHRIPGKLVSLFIMDKV